MQKALYSILAGAVVGAPLFAQNVSTNFATWSIDPATGQKTTALQDLPELNNLALNVTQVAQLYIIPNPAGSGATYLGAATVQKLGASDFDPMTFEWTPGSNPVVTTWADTLVGPADEFQLSLSWDGLATVTDTGAGHTVGNGNPILATRANLTSQFGNMVAMTGIPGGYIDPQLGRLNGVEVLFWTDGTGPLWVGDIDRDPNSPNYGSVSNVREAAPADRSIPNFNYNHSPTPCNDANGNAIGLIFSTYVTSSGSDTFYLSTAESSAFPAAASSVSFPMFGVQTSDDGTAWNNNPAAIKGTFVYAHSGSYADVRRVEACTLSSCTYPAASGGTVSNTIQLPTSLSNDNVLGAVNYGVTALPNPIDPNVLPGIVGYGSMTVAPIVSVTAGLVQNLEANVSFSMAGGALPSGSLLYTQAILFNVSVGNEVYLSNVAYIEAR